jgi:hypothetical protein
MFTLSTQALSSRWPPEREDFDVDRDTLAEREKVALLSQVVRGETGWTSALRGLRGTI